MSDVGEVSFKQNLLQSLGMEARSILRSIENEEAKMLQSPQLTRSDRHYFRARFNYYRLSILRLPTEERDVIEPVLSRFLSRISILEGVSAEPLKSVAPFLEPVPNATPDSSVEEIASESARPQTSKDFGGDSSQETNFSGSLAKYLISELSLVKIALTGEITPENQRIIADAVSRSIEKLKKTCLS